jgi:membrane-bound metal-dependent hydrolase YbcI (DUF457 family)
MPQAAAHILVPLFILSLIRDFFKKKNGKKFSLHYVLIGGIAGIIPDLDIVAFWVLAFFGYAIQEVHRTFMHTIFIPLIFIIMGFLFMLSNLKIGRHKLKLSAIFFLLAFGSFFHLLLDAILAGSIMPFYPISYLSVGLDLFGLFPKSLEEIAAPSLDAGLLIIYIIYLELRHKISDFI